VVAVSKASKQAKNDGETDDMLLPVREGMYKDFKKKKVGCNQHTLTLLPDEVGGLTRDCVVELKRLKYCEWLSRATPSSDACVAYSPAGNLGTVLNAAWLH
jgi:hypothetical protein